MASDYSKNSMSKSSGKGTGDARRGRRGTGSKRLPPVSKQLSDARRGRPDNDNKVGMSGWGRSSGKLDPDF